MINLKNFGREERRRLLLTDLRAKMLEVLDSVDEAESATQMLGETNWQELFLLKQEREKDGSLIACNNCGCNISPQEKTWWWDGAGPRRLICGECMKVERDLELSKVLPCYECGTLCFVRELSVFSGEGPEGHYCAECYEIVYRRHARLCPMCLTSHLPRLYSYEGCSCLCSKCTTPDLRALELNVRSHNQRAREVGLVADLTLKQWVDALVYFDRKCAYCSKKFDTMEHYLPLSRGGGTTLKNCLPACQRCNAKKGRRSPDDFAKIFPAQNMLRISEYFSGVTFIAVGNEGVL